VTYLGLVEDGAVAVEELEGSHELALHEAACEHRRRRPPPGTYGHLPEPRLEREATAVAHHLVHGCGLCGGCEEDEKRCWWLLRRGVATIGLAEGKVGIEGVAGEGGSSEVGGSDLGGGT